ncbi:MAG: hypothetical protein ACLVL2_16795 [Bacteroides cellulosilyticus]
MAKIHIIIKVNLFTDTFLSDPYPRRIWAVLAPYVLHAEVPLTEESTALIRSKSYIHARSQATISEAICIPKEIIEQYEVKERPGNYLNLKFGLSIRLGKK